VVAWFVVGSSPRGAPDPRGMGSLEPNLAKSRRPLLSFYGTMVSPQYTRPIAHDTGGRVTGKRPRRGLTTYDFGLDQGIVSGGLAHMLAHSSSSSSLSPKSSSNELALSLRAVDPVQLRHRMISSGPS
jgi:hypothetical protein